MGQKPTLWREGSGTGQEGEDSREEEEEKAWALVRHGETPGRRKKTSSHRAGLKLALLWVGGRDDGLLEL